MAYRTLVLFLGLASSSAALASEQGSGVYSENCGRRDAYTVVITDGGSATVRHR